LTIRRCTAAVRSGIEWRPQNWHGRSIRHKAWTRRLVTSFSLYIEREN
jgi:hypothetical protein